MGDRVIPEKEAARARSEYIQATHPKLNKQNKKK
jgi:hypothetical protein